MQSDLKTLKNADGARKQRVVIKYGDIPSVTGTDGLDWGRKAGGKMGWMTPTPTAPQPPPPKAPILGIRF